MRREFAIVGGNAKSGAAEVGPLPSHSGAIVKTFEKLFSESTRKVFARALGISEGAAKKKLEGERSVHLDEFIALLRTPAGFHYLTTVMADSQVRWWLICKPLMEVAEIQEMQIKARRRLAKVVQGAFDADADLTAARARAEALLVQDEDFYRGHADALSAMGRVSHRAMAAPAKGK